MAFPRRYTAYGMEREKVNTYEIEYRDDRSRDGVAWVIASSVVDAVGVLMVQASTEGIHRVVTKLTMSESEG